MSCTVQHDPSSVALYRVLVVAVAPSAAGQEVQKMCTTGAFGFGGWCTLDFYTVVKFYRDWLHVGSFAH